MKRNKWLWYVLVPAVLFVVLCYTMVLWEPIRPRLEYYSDSNNYIKSTGTVSYLSWGPNQSYVFLAFVEIPAEYSDTSFVIEGENLRIMQENGFAEKIQLGTEVEYISAPRYFWDGYSMPIVALAVDGETLLSFEEGMQNLLKFIRGD